MVGLVLLACARPAPPPAALDFFGLPSPAVVGWPDRGRLSWTGSGSCLGTEPSPSLRAGDAALCGVHDTSDVLERALYSFPAERGPAVAAELDRRYPPGPVDAETIALLADPGFVPGRSWTVGEGTFGRPVVAVQSGGDVLVYTAW